MKRSRILPILLVCAMIFGMIPAAAFATGPEYTFAKIEYYSNMAKEYVPAGCYYTDSWFGEDPAERNDALALASAQLAAAGGDGEHASAFLTALGFGDTTAVNFDSQANDCAFTMGTKTAGGKTLVAVVFQGDQYGDKGWQQNVTINVEDMETVEQASYAAAAEAFLAAYDELAPAGDVVLWMTGQSRGGAIANLAAAYLLDRTDAPEVFCYTFESPATTSDTVSVNDAKYAAIHNYVADDDPVAMLPPWGMVRYGQVHVYNTAPVEDVIEELRKLNPLAYEAAQEYDPEMFEGGVKAFLEDLMGQLMQIVPTREAYSAMHQAFFVQDGNMNGFFYTYQEGLQALCHLIFGTEGDLISKVMPLLNYFDVLTYSGIEEAYAVIHTPENQAELLSHATLLRWNVAGLIAEGANEGLEEPVVTQSGLYALLSFLTPMIVKTEDVMDADWTLPPYDEEWIEIFNDYFSLGALGAIADSAITVVFSHHPDVIIARLSLLAPAPEMDDVALTITAPAAGDAAGLAPAELEEAVEDLDLSWLTCTQAEWLTEDDPLQDGTLYYLQMTLSPVAHTVPDDLSVTINGQAPAEFEIAYEGGPAQIRGIWTFPMGTLEQVSVTFDENGHGETPEAWTVDKGTMLVYADETPVDFGVVKDETGSWRFDGWFDEDGTPWDEITANADVTLIAQWTQVVDEIAVTYVIPNVGDRGDAILQVSVPEDVLYWIDTDPEELYVMNEDWSEVDRIEDRSEHMLSFKVRIPDGIEFLAELNEYGEPIFAGPLTINGEQIGGIPWVSTEEDWDTGEQLYDYIQVTYYFKPVSHTSGPSAPEEPEETERFVDVPDDAYYAKAVDWAVANGVTAGTDETHFSPDLDCTRAQVLTMLWAAMGCPEGYDQTFEDVPGDAYYAKAVAWAVEKGITAGTDETHFSPDRTVTRAQAMTFLWAASGTPETESAQTPFEDVPSDAYYAKAVAWAVSQGITAGTDATHFSPDASCTRAQVVTFLYLALGQN